MVSSTKPASFSVSVWIATGTSNRSATARQQSIAAGVVPQSSWSLRPLAPAAICSSRGAGSLALPLPSRPQLTGSGSAASSIRAMFHGPGVQVVALVPSAGPVPPPIIVVMPLDSAWCTCCGAIMWMCESTPPGVAIRCSPAMTSVPGPTTKSGCTPSMTPGLPDLPTATMCPRRTPMSALMMPRTGSMMMALVMTRSSAPLRLVASDAWPMPSRADLPPPNTSSSPGVSRSRSIWQTREVSARRKRSPTVGP